MIVMPRRTKNVRDIDDISEAIGQRIAHFRKQRGLSQTELAERLEIAQNLLSAYEVGRARIGADVVLKIAKELHISADEILGLKKDTFAGKYPSRRILKRLESFEDLPKRKQDALVQTIDAFLRMGEA